MAPLHRHRQFIATVSGTIASLYVDGKVTGSDSYAAALNTAAGPLRVDGVSRANDPWMGMPGDFDACASTAGR